MAFFDDMLTADAAVFGDLGGEVITYTPPTGAARTITAIIDRNPPQLIDGMGNTYRPAMVISVINSATLGVSSSEPIRGGKFTIPIRHGHESTKNCIIENEHEQPTAQDAGRLTFTF